MGSWGTSGLESKQPQRRGEFDDALKGYYHDHDEVLPDEDAGYRSLSAESVGSLILGILSCLVFISMLFIIFPIMGIVLGVNAIRKILRASQEHAGLGMASAGAGLSALMMVAGSAYQIYNAQFEVPAGYAELTFEDMAVDSKTGKIPEEIRALAFKQDEQGQSSYVPVFIEGYMFPTRQMTEIKTFMLVPSVDQSQFGALTRNPTQMVDVTFLGDFHVSYRTGLVKVGGMLYINPDPKPGETPYSLKADVYR